MSTIASAHVQRWNVSHTSFCTDLRQSVKNACTGCAGKKQQQHQRYHRAGNELTALHIYAGNRLACILGCTDCFWARTRCASEQWWCGGSLVKLHRLSDQAWSEPKQDVHLNGGVVVTIYIKLHRLSDQSWFYKKTDTHLNSGNVVAIYIRFKGDHVGRGSSVY